MSRLSQQRCDELTGFRISIVEELAAVRQGGRNLQAGVATLVARKGADPAKAAGSLAVSVAQRRKDVARFKSATKASPTAIKLTLEKLDKRLLAFSEALGAIPKDRPLSKGDADRASSSNKRVMDEIDALFGLLEPVVHR